MKKNYNLKKKKKTAYLDWNLTLQNLPAVTRVFCVSAVK